MWPFGKRRTLQQELDSIYMEVDTSSEQAHLTSLSLLAPKKRAVWLAACLKREVENGGFAQYFWNVEDERFYGEASYSLAQVGANGHLAHFEKALNFIRPHLALMHTWQGANDRFTKYKPFLEESGLYHRLQELDGLFYDQSPGLNEILSKFLGVKNEE